MLVMDNENIKTCGEKKEQQSRASTHSEKKQNTPSVFFKKL
jgi:hypothetical protein